MAVVALAAAAALCVVLAGGPARAQAPGAASISEVAAGDRALTVVWTAPSDDDSIVAYDLRYIETSADETVDDDWAVVETVWESGPLHHVLAGLDNGAGYDVQVRAVAAETGAWSQTVAGTPADHGGTLETATVLDLGVPAGGFIEGSSDIDHFELTLTEPLGLLAYTTGGVMLRTILRDGGGNRIGIGSPGAPLTSDGDFVIWRTLEPGTYYLEVYGWNGAISSYVLHTGGTVDGPSFEEAVPVAVDSVTPGVLADPTAMGDYFKLELSEQADLLIRTTGRATDTVGSLYDDQRELIAGNDDGYLLERFQFMIRARLDAGVYYINVRGFHQSDTGLYLLHVSEVVEPGSTTVGAAPLAVGGVAAGRIGSVDDVDYFRLEVQDHGLVMIRAVSESAGINPTLLDSDANPLGTAPLDEVYGGDRLIGATIVRTLEPGTYYLRVDTEGWDGSAGESATGGYAVSVFEDLRYRELLASCGPGDAAVSDPLYGCQWYLDNDGQFGATAGEDINIGDVWQTTTGTGVNVVVVDQGVDDSHEDLSAGFDAPKSHDYTESLGFYTPSLTHGTQVAGIIAARDNGIGVRGVAPGATIRSSNLLLNHTLANEADAMVREADTTAVSNNSWGPGHHAGADRASRLWELAVEDGLKEGHSGLGTFYAWAAGNGHRSGDDSNLDEYTNFYGVTAVCAVDHRGERSGYSEKGANLWVCAPSSSDPDDPGVTTTLNAVLGGYTGSFGGTSAATPQVAGVAALVRSVNPALGWRDVKLILAGSARKNHPGHAGWETGALQYGSDAGDPRSYEFNHSYGFGVVDAEAAVELAGTWTNVAALVEDSGESAGSPLAVPDSGTAVSTSVAIGSRVQFVEFVAVDVVMEAPSFRNLRMHLVSPSGAVSELLVPTRESYSRGLVAEDGPYRLGSARHLGEDPEGEWTLRIVDEIPGAQSSSLVSWTLTVYGHRSSPGPPKITSVDGVNDPLTVTWEAPATAGSSAVTGYDLRHIRSDTVDKDDDSVWTPADGVWTSGPLSHQIAASGLESGVDYDVQVRAVNTAGAGAWSRTVAARLGGALTAPRFPSSETRRRSVVENTAAGVDVGAAVAAEDSDDDALTYTKRGIDAAAFEIVASTGQLRTKAALNHEIQTLYSFTVVAVDDSGLFDEIEVTVSVEDVNEPPVLYGNSMRSITEGPPDGFWSTLIRAWDPERLDVTLSLSGPDASLFAIGPVQLVAPLLFVPRTWNDLRFIEAPDYEEGLDADGDGVYEVTVEASDGVLSESLAVEVTVDDANEPPELSGDEAVSFDENGVAAVATYQAPDPEGDAVQWAVTGPDRLLFSIDVGDLRFRMPPDFEAAADAGEDNVYNVLVWAFDDEFASRLDVVVTVGNVDEDGSLVLSSVQPSVSAELTAELSDGDGGVSGEVWVWASSDDGSTWATVSSASSYTPVQADVGKFLRLTASYVDAHGSRKSLMEETAAVRVQPPANNPPRFPAGETGARHVRENTLARMSVGAAVAAVDPEDDALVYSLGGADAAVFDIVETTGQLLVKDELDYEADSSYSLVVSVRDNLDADGDADTTVDDTVAVAVTIDDVNEPPTVTGETAVDYDENDDAPVGSYLAADPEMRTMAFSFSLSGVDAGVFSISAGGMLEFRTPPDFEALADTDGDNDYLVTVRASDGATTTALDVVVSLGDVSEPPLFPTAATGRGVAENTAAGASVGAAVAAVDPEDDALVYSLGGAAAAVFDIVETTGQLLVKDELDYEVDRRSYSLVVSVRDNLDADGNADTAVDDSVAVAVSVIDVDEPPTLIGAAVVGYDENATGSVLAYSAVDPERVDVEWLLFGPDSGGFAISVGGVISFDASVGSPDFEDPVDADGDNRYYMFVGAFDGLNPVARDLTVVVVNVDETGVVALSSQQPQARTPLSASVSDPDGGVGAVSWQWQSATDPSDPSSWSDIAGATGSAFTPGVGDVGKYLRVGASYRDAHAAGKTAGAQAREPVQDAPLTNRAPRFEGSGTWQRSVDENTAADRGIGAAVAAVDLDTDDTLTYSLGGDDAASFDIDTATGQLRTKAALDRETRSSYTVTVTAADPSRESDTVTVVVTVADIDEAPQLSGPAAANHQENSTGPVAVYKAPDPEKRTVTWTRSGNDAARFTIAGGSLEFRDPPDHDRPADTGEDNKYQVTVKASDGHNTAEIDVTVTVTGIDEAPAITGNNNVEHPENTAAVGAYTATDPEQQPVSWSPLEGTDAHLFALSHDAKLSFKLAPDHENPNDTDRDNIYDVTLVASDSAKQTRHPVTVTVTDQNDPGTITLSTQQPRVATPLTATLNDPDGAASDIVWQWEHSTNQTNWTQINTATTAHYTPTETDLNHHLRITATYTDTFDPDQTTRTQTQQPVTAATNPDNDNGDNNGGGNNNGGGSGVPGAGGVGNSGVPGGGETAPQDTAEFTDVSASNAHAANIDALVAAGITVGCGREPLRFCPGAAVTRAQMATFLARALNLEPPENPAQFTDVSASSAHATNIDALAAAGITTGCAREPLRFCPDDAVTRAQMATFLARALNLEPPENPAQFTDVSASSAHATNIDALAAAGITTGCAREPLRFCPDDAVTRAQMATFLARALSLGESG